MVVFKSWNFEFSDFGYFLHRFCFLWSLNTFPFFPFVFNKLWLKGPVVRITIIFCAKLSLTFFVPFLFLSFCTNDLLVLRSQKKTNQAWTLLGLIFSDIFRTVIWEQSVIWGTEINLWKLSKYTSNPRLGSKSLRRLN